MTHSIIGSGPSGRPKAEGAMWLILESTSDPRAFETTHFESEEGEWQPVTDSFVPKEIHLSEPLTEKHFSRVHWVAKVVPRPAHLGGSGWRVEGSRRLTEFVAADASLSESEWLRRLSSRQLAVNGKPEGPAFCRWPDKPGWFLGPLRFPATASGAHVGPSEESLVEIVVVDDGDLTEIDCRGPRVVLRPGLTPRVEAPFLLASPSKLAHKTAEILSETVGELPAAPEASDAFATVCEFLATGGPGRMAVEDHGALTATRYLLDHVIDGIAEVGALSEALVEHPAINKRIEESLESFREQREREIEGELWQEIQSRDRELLELLEKRRVEVAEIEEDVARAKQDYARIREEAREVQEELIGGTRRAIADLKSEGVTALSQSLLIDGLLKAHGSAPPVLPSLEPRSPVETVDELLYRIAGRIAKPAANLSVRVGLAGVLTGRVVGFGGEFADAWAGFMTRVLGGVNAWTVWCRTDVFGAEDLLRSPALRAADSLPARLGRALTRDSNLRAIPAAHLVGLSNAPWNSGANALIRSLARSEPLAWAPSVDGSIEVFQPSVLHVYISLDSGETAFAPDPVMADAIAIWEPTVPPPSGEDLAFDITEGLVQRAKGEFEDRGRRLLAGDPRVAPLLDQAVAGEVATWVGVLAQEGTEVDPVELTAVWAASTGGWLDAAPTGIPEEVIVEMRVLTHGTDDRKSDG